MVANLPNLCVLAQDLAQSDMCIGLNGQAFIHPLTLCQLFTQKVITSHVKIRTYIPPEDQTDHEQNIACYFVRRVRCVVLCCYVLLCAVLCCVVLCCVVLYEVNLLCFVVAVI